MNPMSFTFIREVSLLQAAVEPRLTALAHVASDVVERIGSLPQWRVDEERPRSLSDLLRPMVVLRFVLDPQMAVAVCRALNLDPRDVFHREILPSRMLPDLNRVDLVMSDRLHAVPAAKIIKLLEDYPHTRLFVTRAGRPETEISRRSIIALLMMSVREDETLAFRAVGEGAGDVLRRLREYNEAGWFKQARRPNMAIWQVKGQTPEAVAKEVQLAIEGFGAKEISGIYHTRSRRLFVGWLVDGHRQIAEAAGITDSGSYTRINFDGRRKGTLFAYFPGELPGEDLLGRLFLRKWLAELFDGMAVP